jgi:large subunit ribosomal protein L13
MKVRTFMLSKEEAERSRKWWVVDATGKSLGRLCASVAAVLRGKHKPTFTPHVDCGDHVIIINAEKVKLTGKSKPKERIYWHTGYPGGLKSIRKGELLAKNPERLIMHAVKGMLPHNALGKHMLKKLRVYRGSEHPHQAQKPEPLDLK